MQNFKNKANFEKLPNDRKLDGGNLMGMYKYLTRLWQDAKDLLEPIKRERILQWRKQPAIVRIKKPTRIDKARRLGYKAKQGFVIVRARIKKGGRPKRYGMFFTPTRNLQAIVEQRVNRKFPNLEVLNSYYVGDDSVYEWYEVILVDPNHPAIKNDKDIGWIVNQRGRAFRGLTSAGKRSRNSRRKK